MQRFFERRAPVSFGALLVASLACAPPPPVVTTVVAPLPLTDTVAVPIDALGARTYHGLQGGLYPGGANVPPADYHSVGVARANAVRPLAVNGIPSVTGKYVLMSVGGPGVTAAWCSMSSAPPCDSWTFTGRAVSDPSVNHSSLVIVNAAAPGRDIGRWANAGDSIYTRIRDTRLAPLGLSENQVQVIWMVLRDSATNFSRAASPNDAAPQLRNIESVIRALKSRYPNLQLLFVSARVYSVYAPNAEPSAYESGFVVKWAIESQIAEARDRPANTAPWISWGPYLWNPSWPRTEFDSAGTGLSQSGRARIAGSLLEFFKTSPYTRCWFVAGATCN
jgi:hypothetical protein